MKKSLLNYKFLNYAFLLLLLCANSMYSQTVFEETFGTTAVISPFIGGTSNPSVSYTQFNTPTYNKINTATNVLVTTQSSTTSTSTSVTLSASNSLIQVGQFVTGTGVAANTTVSAISGTTLTLSQATTTSATVTLSFSSPNLCLNFASLGIAFTTQTASTTSASNSVTLLASNSNIIVGQVVTGTGVPTSGTTTVTAINGTTLTLSQNAASTNTTTTLSFFKADARISLAGALPSETSGLKGNLQTNDKLITWTFNMKASRTSTNSFSASTAYPAFKYFSGVVLCATSEGLLSNSSSPGTGYAVTLQKSSVTSGKVSIHLIKFTQGIGDALTPEFSVVAKLIESPDLALTPTSVSTSNNLSIKVTYNKNANVWELLYREDQTPSPFVDPSSSPGTLLPGGSCIDTPTTTPMTHFGFVAGLQASTSTANAYQFDNFKIGLSTLPPYTVPPTTEKRQAFNSTPTPTVANLVVTGTDVKCYDALTGGTLLSPSTPLSYTNYYVSQTVSGTESTRVATQVFVGDTTLKTLPLYEGFANYTLGDKLILMNNGASSALPANQGTGLGSWTITPSTNVSDDVTIVASPTWANTLVPTATGNAITFVGSGIDPELKFTNTTSGSLYSSFLFTAADATSIKTAQVAADEIALAAGLPTPVTLPSGIDAAKSTPTGIYSFSTENVVAGVATTEYSADVMFRKVFGTTSKFNIGLSKSNNGEECVWSTTEYDFGTQYLIMISYENIGDADPLNQVAKLWIDPTTNTTPLPTPTLTQNNPTTSITRTNLDRIKILQASSSSTPTLNIDEIRVANNWGQALGGAATLGITSVKTSEFKIYPNPVLNGKLYITSATNLEKEVVIFNTLGQQVLQAKTVTEAINVSNLNKGTYFVKITEAGISATKKLVIQ